MDYIEMAQLGIPLLALAGGLGGVKAIINGTVKRVDKIESTQLELVRSVSSMETKIYILVERK